MQGLVLVEVVTNDRYKAFRNGAFPFVKAFADTWGFTKAHWLSVGVDAHDPATQIAPYVFELPEADRKILCRRLSQLAPAKVILNERLGELTWQALKRAVPDADAAMIGPWLLDLGHGPIDQPLEQLVTRPDYSRELLNDRAWQARPLVPLRLGPMCLHRRSVTHNPAFAGVDLSGCVSTEGCSFCAVTTEKQPRRSETVQLAMRQLLAAEATLPDRLKIREFLVNGAWLWMEMDGFTAALVASGLPPTAFYLHVRADEALEMATRVEGVLGDLAAHGHSLNLFDIGVENFSARENDRLNKGIDKDCVLEVAELFHDWEQRYPDTFRFKEHGGFGYILFTPWTTLDDLRENVNGLRQLSRFYDDSGFALRTRLQLLPNRPITALAMHDGLVSRQGLDAPSDSGCITNWHTDEIPWRFREPRVGLIARLARRLTCDETLPEGDAELELVDRAIFSRIHHAQRIRLSLFERAIDIVDNQPAVETMEQLVDALASSVVPPESKTDRVGTAMRLATVARDALPARVDDCVIERVEPTHHDRIEITLVTTDQERFPILVALRSEVTAAFAFVGPLALMAPKGQPLDTQDKIRSAHRVAELVANAWNDWMRAAP